MAEKQTRLSKQTHLIKNVDKVCRSDIIWSEVSYQILTVKRPHEEIWGPDGSWRPLTFNLESQQLLSLWQHPGQGLDGLLQVHHRVLLGQGADGVLLTSPLYDHWHRHGTHGLFTHIHPHTPTHTHLEAGTSSYSHQHADGLLAKRRGSDRRWVRMEHWSSNTQSSWWWHSETETWRHCCWARVVSLG